MFYWRKTEGLYLILFPKQDVLTFWSVSTFYVWSFVLRAYKARFCSIKKDSFKLTAWSIKKKRPCQNKLKNLGKTGQSGLTSPSSTSLAEDDRGSWWDFSIICSRGSAFWWLWDAGSALKSSSKKVITKVWKQIDRWAIFQSIASLSCFQGNARVHIRSFILSA